jgi:transcriptional regulator with XRE-family HTH domain
MSPRFPTPFEYKTSVAKRLHEFFGWKKFFEIASLLELSRQQTARIIRGEDPPTAKILAYIAEHGGDVNYILTGEHTKIDAPAIALHNSTNGSHMVVAISSEEKIPEARGNENSPQIQDSALQIILDKWELLSSDEKLDVANLARDLAKKTN